LDYGVPERCGVQDEMYGCSLITSGLFRSWVCKVVRLGRVGGERKCFVMADRIDRIVVSYYTCIEA
jgi:hypothetical protein